MWEAYQCLDPTQILIQPRPVFSSWSRPSITYVLPPVLESRSGEVPKFETSQIIQGIEPTPIYISPDLYRQVHHLRSQVKGDVHQQDPFNDVGNSIFGNRAATKLACMQSIFKVFVPESGRYVDIAGGPGSWTQYMQYLDPEVIGYGLTLNNDNAWGKHCCSIDYGRFLYSYGPDETGDITKPTNLEDMIGWIQGMNPLGVDLALADGGRGASTEEEFIHEEVLHYKLFVAEILVALRTLRAGGNFVIKMYDLFTQTSAQLVYLLSLAFDKIIIFKPLTSRAGNSEKYVIGFGCRAGDRTRVVSGLLESALEVLQHGPISQLFDQPLPETVVSWLRHNNTVLTQRQISTLEGKEPKADLYSISRIYDLWGIPPSPDVVIKKPAKPFLASSRSGTGIISTETIRDLLTQSGWLSGENSSSSSYGVRPLPRCQLQQYNPAQLAAVITQILASVEFEFPYKNRYMTLDQVEQGYQLLLKYNPALVRVDKAYPLKNEVKADARFPLPINFQNPGSDERSYYLMPDDSQVYKTIDWIVDYYIEESRMLCMRQFTGQSPYALWHGYGDYVKNGIKYALEHDNKLDLETIREGLYATAHIHECGHEKASFLRVLLHFLGLQPGQRLFDACAGWGDRLLATISLGADYLGIDPNLKSQDGFRRMAELVNITRAGSVGGPQAQVKPLSMPLDPKDLPPAGSFDITFMSPPAFSGERYSDDAGQSTVRFSANDKTKWLNQFLYPTIDQCWQLTKPGGYYVIQSVMIEDIAPYMIDNFEDLFLCGPISVSFPSRNKPMWIWYKLRSTDKLTRAQTNARNQYLKVSRAYMKDYEADLASEGQVDSRSGRDEFPYYYKVLPRADVMFKNLQKTRRESVEMVRRRWPEDYETSDFISCHFSEIPRMLCNNSGELSPRAYWDSLSPDEQHRRLASGIRAANDQLYRYICNVFNPYYCLQIILNTVGEGATILDPSAGWGDRMIAALASKAAIYRGVDPNTQLTDSYYRIVEQLGPLAFPGVDPEALHNRFRVYPEYFDKMEIVADKFDLALTSPPYYTLEEYHQAQTGMTYPEWIERVYRPYIHNMYKAVKPGGWIVVYIENFTLPGRRVCKMRDDTIDIIDALGGQRQSDFGLTVTAKGYSEVPRYAVRWIKPGVLGEGLDLELSSSSQRLVTQNTFTARHRDFSDYFPPDTSSETLSKLRLVDTSLFSTTPYNESRIIEDKIREILEASGLDPQNLTATDATANVGGDTMGLWRMGFKKVTSYEIDPLICQVLKDNLDVLGIPSQFVMCKDFTTSSIYQDVLFVDPPWGGPDYWKVPDLEIYLGDKILSELIDTVLKQQQVKLLILKLPLNYHYRAEIPGYTYQRIDIERTSRDKITRVVGKHPVYKVEFYVRTDTDVEVGAYAASLAKEFSGEPVRYQNLLEAVVARHPSDAAMLAAMGKLMQGDTRSGAEPKPRSGAGDEPSQSWRAKRGQNRARDILNLIGPQLHPAPLHGLGSAPAGKSRPDAFPTSILDIGGGKGEIITSLGRELGLGPDKLFAIEPKKIYSQDFTSLDYGPDGTHIPLPDASVDLIIMMVVLHHIVDDQRDKIVKEAARVLTPNGRLVIREHDSISDPYFQAYIALHHMGWYIKEHEAVDPLFFMSRQQVQEMMLENSLTPVGFKTYTGLANPQRLYYEVYAKSP